MGASWMWSAAATTPDGVDVVLRDELIEALEQSSESDVTIDLGGRTVIPGMFNTHAHVSFTLPNLVAGPRDLMTGRRLSAAQIDKSMSDCATAGVTHVRDVLAYELQGNRRLAARIERGELLGPRLSQCVHVGPLGGAMSPKRNVLEGALHWAGGIPYPDYDDATAGTIAFAVEANARAVRDAVDRAIDERDADAIKLYDQREQRITYAPGAVVMTQVQMDAATDQGRRRGVPVHMHHGTTESLVRGARAGVTSVAHMPHDRPLTDDDVEAFVAAGCIVEPTVSIVYDLCWRRLGAHSNERMAELSAIRRQTHRSLAMRHWVAGLREIAAGALGQLEEGKTKVLGVMDLAPAFRYFAGLIGHGVDNLRKLHRAGVVLGCGNDAGPVPRTEAMVGLELMLLRVFLDGDDTAFGGADAVRVATINSARALGVSDRFGTITPGKVADLAVLDRDPFADPTVLGEPVAALFKGGELVVDACQLR